MPARISTSIACLAAAVALLVSGPATATPRATAARGGLSPCETLSFRGRHHLSQRNLGCGAAKQHAMFVVKRLKAPPGWNCSGKLLKGQATCHQGRKAFSVTPA